MDTSGSVAEVKAVQRRRAFLVQDFADVDRPLESVCGRFVGDGCWLAPIADAAHEEGESLRVRIGPAWSAGRVSREVRVHLGPPHRRGDALVVPISWEAVGLRSLFPMLDGDVELAPLGAGRCRLTLSASYVPPLGELGARLDQALLHRVAASTVRAFVSRIATSLLESGEYPCAPDTAKETSGPE